MGHSIPVGPWPDSETAQAFGGNALRTAAQMSGEIITEWAAVRRPDGLWQAEGYCHPAHALDQEGTYLVAGASPRP